MTLVDGHVHLHPCFELNAFFNAAYRNFSRWSGRSYRGAPFVGVLLLTEGAHEKGFERLLLYARNEQRDVESWRVVETKEDSSVMMAWGETKVLIVISGRQIVTQEGLEVLAIGVRTHFGEGEPLASLIRETADRGALPVVPWGFGKWLGNRGRLVQDLLEDNDLPPFFLGDNGNRPALWPLPDIFNEAETRGIRNLAGSDPLPFSAEHRRPGSYGFALEAPLDTTEPTKDLKNMLLDTSIPLRAFGKGETAFQFVPKQIRMQYEKRVRRS